MPNPLAYVFDGQETGWFCGPASVQIALRCRGINRSEADLAKALGTTTFGTNSSADIVRVMNAQLGAGTYDDVYIPGDTATEAETAAFKTALVRSIDAGYAIVANVVGTIKTLAGASYGYPGGHYVAVTGYRAGGDEAYVADVGAPAQYWVTTRALAVWIAARGYTHLIKAAAPAATTTHFPDVSNHQPGLSLSGAQACIAKASEGTTFTDKEYPRFKAQAQQMGIPFAAYHWLHKEDVPGQARHAYSIVGPDVPLMIDDEDTTDGLDTNRTLAFVREYRALGGTVTLEYLPKWFWADHGSPDLRPLAAAGLSLVSSHYTTYSDTGPGWAPYGGVTPSIWQYTSSQPFNGQRIDFNAFKGTVEQLRDLFGGSDVSAAEVWSHRFKGHSELTGQDYDYSAQEMVTGANEAAWRAVVDIENKVLPALAELKAMLAAGAGGGATPAQVRTIVDEELDEQSRAGADANG